MTCYSWSQATDRPLRVWCVYDSHIGGWGPRACFFVGLYCTFSFADADGSNAPALLPR